MNERQFALQLAKTGYNIVLVARNLTATADEIVGAAIC